MKFINYLEGITGVGIFPLTSLLIFFLFFVGLSIYMFRIDRSHVSYMSALPVDANEEGNTDDSKAQ